MHRSLRPPIPIGFWKTAYADGWPELPLPDPHLLVRPNYYTPEDKLRLAQYLDAGATYIQWRGGSWCRICPGKGDNGTRDLTDGTWVWPEGLAHYIEKHDVILPDEFVNHARRNQWQVPEVDVTELLDAGDYDTSFAVWVLWCEREIRCPSRAFSE